MKSVIFIATQFIQNTRNVNPFHKGFLFLRIMDIMFAYS